MNPRALYIHVPFCARRCSYCDFAVEATRDPPVAEWVEAVGRELELTAAEREWQLPLHLDTLYVGGGTPSLLGTKAMSTLLGRLSAFVRIGPDTEWTCEANPESFTPELAADWHAAGVNRVSLGVQSFDSGTLRWMGRLHGPEGARAAVAAAHAEGIENVSVDLIFAVPDHLERNWEDDLRQAVDLAPQHISLYGLTAETGAPLGRWVREGREVLAGEDRYADEYLLAHEILTRSGYEHYEVSNFARDGLRSRHNVVYWAGAPYAALGPGAHSFEAPVRQWNLRSWAAYRESVRGGRRPLEGEERLDRESEELERIWLGLRTSSGYSMSEAGERQIRLVSDWVRAGVASLSAGTVRLNERGWLLLDELALDLHKAGADRPVAPPATPGNARIDEGRRLVQIAANSSPFL
jgi:oxygen-independent coproporphyrinogen III oxidase